MQTSCIHVYCGGGKGKTTAAIGQLLRAHGAGLSTQLFQFLKDGSSSEATVLRQLGVPVRCAAGSKRFYWQMNAAEQQAYAALQQALFAEAARAMACGAAQLIVLDEVLDACALGMLSPSEVQQALAARQGCEVILTGREGRFLLPFADYYTELTSVRHPYDLGRPARRGIEF